LKELKPHEREVLTSIFVPTNPMLLLSQSIAQLARVEEATGHEALSSFTSGVVPRAEQAADQYRAISGFQRRSARFCPDVELVGPFSPASTTDSRRGF